MEQRLVAHAQKERKRKIAYRDVGVSGVALGIGGGEDGVDKDEGADDLSAEAIALGVARGDNVGTAAPHLVLTLLEALHDTRAADGTKALHNHVEHRPRQR